MLSPVTASNVRVEDRERREKSRQRPPKRQKGKTAAQIHEENRGDKIDLTA
jgi:hypothetical protein